MIHTYSSTIRRKEMEAVLTCMVDEKIGPGEMSSRLVQTAKELIGFDGAVALRSPAIALEYIFKALDLPKESGIILSALAPSYQILTVEKNGYKPLIADVNEETGLVSVESVEKCVKNGGRLLVFTESMGILPDLTPFMELGIPIVEDISQSVFASYPVEENAESTEQKQSADNKSVGKKAGMCGLYAILGMEDRDIVTAGGGALLLAPSRREWIVLKHIAETSPITDFLPDMNAALALVELKEFARNEKSRRELFTVYSRAVMAGRHKTFLRPTNDDGSTIYSFPLVLNSSVKEVKAYAQKKNIEIKQAYENSIIALRQEELSSDCICANSLLLRCVLFPLYPRLGQKDVSQIVKVLSSLP